MVNRMSEEQVSNKLLINVLLQEIKEVLSIQVRNIFMVIQQTQTHSLQNRNVDNIESFSFEKKNTKTLNSNTRILHRFYLHSRLIQRFLIKVLEMNLF